jgi:hypothetical protein
VAEGFVVLVRVVPGKLGVEVVETGRAGDVVVLGGLGVGNAGTVGAGAGTGTVGTGTVGTGTVGTGTVTVGTVGTGTRSARASPVKSPMPTQTKAAAAPLTAS